MTVQEQAFALNEWHLGSMNDGLFIIDTPPRPSTDEVHHDRKDGPTLVLNVTNLPHEKAQAIVDAHNRALRTGAATPAASSEVRERVDGAPNFPGHGKIPFADLVEAVGLSLGWKWVPEQDIFIGHQVPPTLNMNSINRIATYFQDSALSALRPGDTIPGGGAPSNETGWVIERGDSEPFAPTYWAGIEDRWSQDHQDAIRFARKCDAERISARMRYPNNRVCEHVWYSPATAETKETAR